MWIAVMWLWSAVSISNFNGRPKKKSAANPAGFQPLSYVDRKKQQKKGQSHWRLHCLWWHHDSARAPENGPQLPSWLWRWAYFAFPPYHCQFPSSVCARSLSLSTLSLCPSCLLPAESKPC
jgi:hypothetical protein